MSLINWLAREGTALNSSSTVKCSPLSLPKGGTIILNSTFSLTLTQNAVFEPTCENDRHPEHVGPATILDLRDPFFASTPPQLYAIAAATVISYLLVIMLFITPRTFFIGGRGGGFLSRRGMISGSYGSSSVVGVGGRPWLQKIAALTVAISLTLATTHSLRVAKEQYNMGYMDSNALTNEVLNGLEIRIVRVISATFLWLAQVQTLIRLFPRHKEKVIIKWVGFALIVLDTIFTLLNNFVNSSDNTFQARNIVQAIPALNYLFELSLSLLYAAWVIFYSLSKHRFAFFHTKMKNICLVALLSLVAVLIPVIFFIVDLSKPVLSAWGEYIRWVGAAAASVVVWEWVERIEALEREERKDGILGREIFDGDEMLDVTPSQEVDWPRRPRRGPGNSGGSAAGITSGWWPKRMHFGNRPLASRVTFANRLPRPPRKRRHQEGHDANQPGHPDRPPQTLTPNSRTDTASVASTIYRVRYHTEPSPAPSIARNNTDEHDGHDDDDDDDDSAECEMEKSPSVVPPVGGNSPAPVLKQGLGWLNFFTRRRASPPQEVATAQAEEGNRQPSVTESGDGTREEGSNCRSKNLRSTAAGLLSLLQKDSGKSTTAAERHASKPLPVTVIPARTRQHNVPGVRASAASNSTQQQQQQQQQQRQQQSQQQRTEGQQASDPLPVMVIPAQPRAPSRAWSMPATTRESPPVADTNSHRQSLGHESPRLSFSLPGSTAPRDCAARSAASYRENFATVREEEHSAEGVPFSSSPTALTPTSRPPSGGEVSARPPSERHDAAASPSHGGVDVNGMSSRPEERRELTGHRPRGAGDNEASNSGSGSAGTDQVDGPPYT